MSQSSSSPIKTRRKVRSQARQSPDITRPIQFYLPSYAGPLRPSSPFSRKLASGKGRIAPPDPIKLLRPLIPPESENVARWRSIRKSRPERPNNADRGYARGVRFGSWSRAGPFHRRGIAFPRGWRGIVRAASPDTRCTLCRGHSDAGGRAQCEFSLSARAEPGSRPTMTDGVGYLYRFFVRCFETWKAI